MGIDSQHAPLAPSRAYRWGPNACPGSAAMERLYPEDEESEDARRGTAAHWFVTEALQGREVTIGTLAPNGFPVDLEMVQCAADLLTDVQDTLAAASPDRGLWIESRVTMKHAIHSDCWGTPDIYLLDFAQRALHVWDYKYGHRYVDAYMNWQMIAYAVGVFETHGIEDYADWRITLTIAQPRNYAPEGPMREWFLNGRELMIHRESLRVAAIHASQPEAILKTGNHCRDCLAAHACPALQRAAMAAVDLSYKQGAIDMPAPAVGLELAILTAGARRIQARLDALSEHAMGLIRKGQGIPHWTLGRTQPRTVWKVSVEEVVAMGRLFQVDLAKPEAITPKQAIKAGIDEAVIAEYADTPMGSIKLIPMDDSSAAKAFGGQP